jgi:hypothetical protein
VNTYRQSDDVHDLHDLHDRFDRLAERAVAGVELAPPGDARARRPMWRGRAGYVLAVAAVLAVAVTAVAFGAGEDGAEYVLTGPDSPPAGEQGSARVGQVVAVVAVVPGNGGGVFGDGIVGASMAVRFLGPTGDEIARRNMAELTDDKPGILEGGMLQGVPAGSQQVELTMHLGIDEILQCTRAFHADPGEQIIIRIEALTRLEASGPPRCPGRDESVAEWADGATGPTGEPYVGLTLTQAEERARQEGLTTRVVGRDGADLAVTMDLRPDRLNLMVFAETVVAARLDTE